MQLADALPRRLPARSLRAVKKPSSLRKVKVEALWIQAYQSEESTTICMGDSIFREAIRILAYTIKSLYTLYVR